MVGVINHKFSQTYEKLISIIYKYSFLVLTKKEEFDKIGKIEGGRLIWKKGIIYFHTN